ncbi:unnamed protein product [Blepharisma stoltei]|uniref:Uncharacterized protein n=1 Tax=Blepharisma stoltei TaxID=1481888 RepID=A0AAU9J8X8_9CILI|nr:unnamed protein product [Blepharisma stoltei]
MLEKSFEITVLRAEPVDREESEVGCYISVDGRLFDVITPLSPDNEENLVQINSIGKLQLILKNMSSGEEIGSVSLPTSILPSEGFQWLPLFQPQSNDYLSSFPEEVTSPRILILVNTKRALTPVQEVTELSELDCEMHQNSIVHSESDSGFMPEIKLCPSPYDKKPNIEDNERSNTFRIIELERAMEEENWRHQEEILRVNQNVKVTIDGLNFEIEKIKAQNKKLESKYLECRSELESNKENLSKEKKETEELKQMFEKLSTEYDAATKKFNCTEASLHKLIEKKDQEMFKLQTELTIWKKNASNFEQQIQKSKAESSNAFQLSQEIGLLKQRLEQSEIQRQNLQRVIQDLNDGWGSDAQLQMLTNENKKLKDELQKLKSAQKPTNLFDSTLKDLEALLESRKKNTQSRTPIQSPKKYHKRSSTGWNNHAKHQDDVETETTASVCSKSSLNVDKGKPKCPSPSKRLLKQTVSSINKGRNSATPGRTSIIPTTREVKSPRKIPFR